MEFIQISEVNKYLLLTNASNTKLKYKNILFFSVNTGR